mmetsp:Transcript_417/g.1107  ORF Transcript_417/g.1107 Transcript_417/m.1107 type:complete len:389 (+) Transcript_417:378-1544(+)
MRVGLKGGLALPRVSTCGIHSVCVHGHAHLLYEGMVVVRAISNVRIVDASMLVATAVVQWHSEARGGPEEVAPKEGHPIQAVANEWRMAPWPAVVGPGVQALRAERIAVVVEVAAGTSMSAAHVHIADGPREVAAGVHVGKPSNAGNSNGGGPPKWQTRLLIDSIQGVPRHDETVLVIDLATAGGQQLRVQGPLEDVIGGHEISNQTLAGIAPTDGRTHGNRRRVDGLQCCVMAGHVQREQNHEFVVAICRLDGREAPEHIPQGNGGATPVIAWSAGLALDSGHPPPHLRVGHVLVLCFASLRIARPVSMEAEGRVACVLVCAALERPCQQLGVPCSCGLPEEVAARWPPGHGRRLHLRVTSARNQARNRSREHALHWRHGGNFYGQI